MTCNLSPATCLLPLSKKCHPDHSSKPQTIETPQFSVLRSQSSVLSPQSAVLRPQTSVLQLVKTRFHMTHRTKKEHSKIHLIVVLAVVGEDDESFSVPQIEGRSPSSIFIPISRLAFRTKRAIKNLKNKPQKTPQLEPCKQKQRYLFLVFVF